MVGQTGSPPHLKEASGLVKLTRGGQKQIGCFFQLLHWVELQTKVMHVFVDVGKFIT